MTVDVPGFAYAAIVAVGGIVGYAKAGSIPSLGAGLVFGGILGYGAYQTSQNRSNYGAILGTSTILLVLMGTRFYNSGKFMPAGLIATLSAAAVLRYSYQAITTTADKVASTVP